MRALVVTELFSPTRGGTAVWFDHVYRTPDAIDSEIIAAETPGADVFDASYPRRIHRLPWRRYGWLKPESTAIYARLFWHTLRLAMGGRFEAVHAGRVLPEGLVAVWVGKLCRLPVMIYAHGEEITGWREAGKRAAMRWAYRHADLVVANSAFTQDQLTRLGTDPRRIAVVHPGVAADRFRPSANGRVARQVLAIGSKPLILSVGRLQARKGFDRVIEALPIISRQIETVQYALIGTGDDEPRLRRLAFQCGVADRVHFLGQVSDEQLPDWYDACDVFAMPNREIRGDTEGFGIVYLEAGASGKCVLAGRDGGTGSSVIDGVTGLRVDGESTSAVAEALLYLLADREVAATMGRRARERVLRRFTWDAVAHRTCVLHRLMIDSGLSTDSAAIRNGCESPCCR